MLTSRFSFRSILRVTVAVSLLVVLFDCGRFVWRALGVVADSEQRSCYVDFLWLEFLPAEKKRTGHWPRDLSRVPQYIAVAAARSRVENSGDSELERLYLQRSLDFHQTHWCALTISHETDTDANFTEVVDGQKGIERRATTTPEEPMSPEDWQEFAHDDLCAQNTDGGNHRKIDTDRIRRIKNNYGDAALPYFVSTRFSSDTNVRQASIGFAGDTNASLQFLLPLTQDSDENVAEDAFKAITVLERPYRQLQRYGGDAFVGSVKTAVERHPHLVQYAPHILLIVSLFPEQAKARPLVEHLARVNQWNTFPARNDWSRESLIALVARCQVGSVSPDEVLRVLRNSPRAREWFLDNIHLVRNETLLRYGLSLLNDTTLIAVGQPATNPRAEEDIPENRVCSYAEIVFCRATHLGIAYDEVASGRRYKKESLAALYQFYGLRR